MSDNAEPVVVHLSVSTGYAGGTHEEDYTIERAIWDAMTPAERRDELDQAAAVLRDNHIEYGWDIVSGAAESEVED